MVNKFYHSVRMNPELCTGCINCIKRCPTQAIRIRNGKSVINHKYCIDCGECIRVCPHHARYACYDGFEELKRYKYTVALPDPSLYSQFNHLSDVNIILNALVKMGFDTVLEVSAAAELVSEVTREYLSQHEEDLPMISTACPSVVRLIRVRFPNLIQHLLPLNSPAEVAARIAAERAMEDTGLPRKEIGIFFITPCPAKVTYAKAPLGTEKSEIDRVVAIKDIYPLLLARMKEVGSMLEDDEDAVLPDYSNSGKIGISWGRSGGEAAALFTDSYLAADGIENVIRVLEDLEDQKLNDLRFVELNACSGGCVGGALMVENPYAAAVKLKLLRRFKPVTGRHANIEQTADQVMHWDSEVVYEPVYSLGGNMMESFLRLGQVEKLLANFPGLDCGACGAPTCRALAEDIVRGEAEEQDCVYCLRDNLAKMSDVVNTLVDKLKGKADDQEILQILKQYVERISNDVERLDNRHQENRAKNDA